MTSIYVVTSEGDSPLYFGSATRAAEEVQEWCAEEGVAFDVATTARKLRSGEVLCFSGLGYDIWMTKEELR